MSAVGIFAIAYGSKHERYDSFHNPPQVSEFIASVKPSTVTPTLPNGGMFAQIDTTQQACTVSAAPSVEVPLANGTEERDFSYWLIKPDPTGPTIVYHCKDLVLDKGEFGLVGLYYGLPGRPKMNWPVRDIKKFDQYVHMMMQHAPGWEPPVPGGPTPLAEPLEIHR